MPIAGKTLGPKSEKVLVRDFGQKLWLLCLVHRAISIEGLVIDDDAMPETVQKWFGLKLMPLLPSGVKLSSRTDVDAGFETVSKNEGYPDFPYIEEDQFPIRYSVLNRCLGINLNKTFASDPRNTNLKPSVARQFRPERDRVQVHVLYLLSRQYVQ